MDDTFDKLDFKLTSQQEENIKKGALETTVEEALEKIAEEHQKQTTLSDRDIIDTFPQDQKIVVDKLQEYWKEASELYLKVKDLRNIVDKIQKDPFSKWFFTQVNTYEETKRLKWLYQQIKRLERLKVVYEKKQVEALLKFAKFDTKEEKKRYNIDRMFARENLLLDIVAFDGIKMRGTGSRFMGLCPFHKEDTPSFAVYSDNWYHCYGCSAHGNFIDYLMKQHKLEFKEALAEANRFI